MFAYLANKPESWTLFFVVLALVLFILAALQALVPALKVHLGWAGLACLTVAFLIS